MRKLLALACVPLFAVVGVACAADRDFTLINKTGFNVYSVFVSPHGTDDWQEDVLGRAVLVNSDLADIKFDRDTAVTKWDLKVTDKDGKAYVWNDINLPGIAKITVEYKNGNPSATYE